MVIFPCLECFFLFSFSPFLSSLFFSLFFHPPSLLPSLSLSLPFSFLFLSSGHSLYFIFSNDSIKESSFLTSLPHHPVFSIKLSQPKIILFLDTCLFSFFSILKKKRERNHSDKELSPV